MKNIKLLLATTAILSMGAVVANADTDSVSTRLRASIELRNPLTMNATGGTIWFPMITVKPQQGASSIYVTVKPDGSVDQNLSNVQILNQMDANGIKDGSATDAIIISGGDINALFASLYANKTTAEERAELDNDLIQEDGSFDGSYNVALSSETIPMTVDGLGSTPCGTVRDLTRHWTYTGTNGGQIELRFGGTFELYKDASSGAYFSPGANGLATCSGQITVTLVHG